MRMYYLYFIIIVSFVFPCFAQRIQPEDLVYLGAFRLPDSPGTPDDVGWEWSNWASGLTYYPDGDPAGPNDGYPGSLFGVGHDQTQYVSEISIPVPVISPTKNVDDLNTAQTLQPFRDIRGGLFGEMEMPRVGLEYLPAQGDQIADKLYFCWNDHMGEGETNPSHGWCELALDDPQSAGTWRIAECWNYVTGDYLFEIPRAWADAHTPGMTLATGRYRDGGQGAQGPSIIACGPWNEGNPPAPGSTLPAVTLLLYGNAYEDNPPSMNGYHHSDEWSGGAWMTAGDKAAVIFVGTKGTGDCWYGWSDGTLSPNQENREGPGEKGWWADSYVGQVLFYDPDDLTAVTRGDMETWQPQPYAALDIDEHLYHVESDQQWHHVGAAAFDRQGGLLYVMEPLVDEEKSLIHVWRVGDESTSVEGEAGVNEFQLLQNYPNPFNPKTQIEYRLMNAAEVRLVIRDVRGREVRRLVQSSQSVGNYTVTWTGKDKYGLLVAAGVYFYTIEIRLVGGERTMYSDVKKMLFMK